MCIRAYVQSCELGKVGDLFSLKLIVVFCPLISYVCTTVSSRQQSLSLTGGCISVVSFDDIGSGPRGARNTIMVSTSARPRVSYCFCPRYAQGMLSSHLFQSWLPTPVQGGTGICLDPMDHDVFHTQSLPKYAPRVLNGYKTKKSFCVETGIPSTA